MSGLIRFLFMIAVLCFSVNNVKAATVSSQLPVTSDPLLNNDIQNAWNAILARPEIAEFNKYDNQDKLAKGFANANTYAVNAGTLDGYQDYSLFAFATGIMLSVQMPAFTVSKSYVENIRYKIEEDGDAYTGASAGISIINAGINAGFIYPGLYINLKYGYLSVKGDKINSNIEGLLYKTSIYGIGLNQIISWPRTVVPGILSWRGFCIGTGFYYSKTQTDIEILKSLIAEPVSGPYSLILDPTFKIKINTSTMTVPVNINTSIKFFKIINFNIGTGVDFNYGYSEIKLKAAGSIRVDPEPPTQTSPGYVTIEGGTKKKEPTTINPKVISGLGFNFGVVKIDIPVVVYYLEAGFSVGLSAGVVW